MSLHRFLHRFESNVYVVILFDMDARVVTLAPLMPGKATELNMRLVDIHRKLEWGSEQ